MTVQENLCHVVISFLLTSPAVTDTSSCVDCGVFHFESSNIVNGKLYAIESTRVNITFTVQSKHFSNVNHGDIEIAQLDALTKVFNAQCKIREPCRNSPSFNILSCQCLDTSGFYFFTFIADKRHNGQWKWTAKQNVQDAFVTFNITYPARIIALEIVGYNAPIAQNKIVTVLCTWENGNPPTSVLLLDGHNKVLANGNIPYTSGNVSYTFAPVDCSHAGVIRCEAYGSNKNMSTTMLIECPPEFERTPNIQKFNIGPNDDVTFPFRSHTPNITSCHITNMKQNTDGDINQPLTGSFKCTKLESNEIDAIIQNNHCLCSVTGKPPDLNLTIHFHNLKRNDGGLWYVNISNEVGSDVLNVQVNINEESVKSSKKGDNLSFILPGVGAGVVIVIVISTVVIVLFVRRRRFNEKNEDTQHNGEENSASLAFSQITYTGTKPKVSRSTQERRDDGNESNHGDHDYNNASVCLLEHTDSQSRNIGVNPSGIKNEPRRKKKKASESVNSSDAKSQIQNAIVHVKGEPTVALVKPVIDRKRYKESEEDDNFEDDDKGIYNNEDLYSSIDKIRFTQLDELQRSLLASLASGHLTQKFKELPKGMIHPHEEGLKPVNRKKNRFKTLFTYDFNRVILERRKGNRDSDYINASYIKGYQRNKAYIAAQGPRLETINDMWWMIWQEGVTQIVMLTNLKEGEKRKCQEYWPVLRSTRLYGDVSVTGVNVEQRADFVIRTFSLKVKGNKLPRQIQQYHYTAWPGQGVPKTTSLVDFWRYVKARAASLVPVLVHCSAGVGRTGTYIALDVAMDTSAHERHVDVHKIVADLREERTTMVQAEAQYKFLYEVILEAYTSRQTRRSLEQFEVMFPSTFNIKQPNDVTDKEFKILIEMGSFVSKPQHLMATSDENKAKNRNWDALPDDSHLVYADVHVKTQNMYINAVFAPSFRHPKGILLTQLPFPETLMDIWRLIDDMNVDTIVSISSRDEQTRVKNFCQYWPKMSRQTISTGPYTIRHVGFSVLSEYITSFHLSLKKDNVIRDIRLLHFTGWNGEVPESTKDTLHLIETLSTNHSDQNAPPVVIQCIDGAARSGLFCILWENIERAKCDRETDVYLTARRIKAIRPQAVTTEVQYRFCYKVIQDFQRQFEIYQNT